MISAHVKWWSMWDEPPFSPSTGLYFGTCSRLNRCVLMLIHEEQVVNGVWLVWVPPDENYLSPHVFFFRTEYRIIKNLTIMSVYDSLNSIELWKNKMQFLVHSIGEWIIPRPTRQETNGDGSPQNSSGIYSALNEVKCIFFKLFNILKLCKNHIIPTSGSNVFEAKQFLAHSKEMIKQFINNAFINFFVRIHLPVGRVFTIKCVTLSFHDMCAFNSNTFTNSCSTRRSSSSTFVYVITICLFLKEEFSRSLRTNIKCIL